MIRTAALRGVWASMRRRGSAPLRRRAQKSCARGTEGTSCVMAVRRAQYASTASESPWSRSTYQEACRSG
eukprot:980378-Alexandrium_andersonii.AAC.1